MLYFAWLRSPAIFWPTNSTNVACMHRIRTLLLGPDVVSPATAGTRLSYSIHSCVTSVAASRMKLFEDLRKIQQRNEPSGIGGSTATGAVVGWPDPVLIDDRPS
jgi:hypothetical protein